MLHVMSLLIKILKHEISCTERVILHNDYFLTCLTLTICSEYFCTSLTFLKALWVTLEREKERKKETPCGMKQM